MRNYCSYAQEQKLTNLDLFRRLARQISSDVMRQAKIEPGSKVHLIVLPKETAWYIDGALGDALKTEGAVVGEDVSAPAVTEFGLASGRVAYTNIRRDGFFGGKLVDRTVELKLTTKITNRMSGTVLWSGDIEKSATDTIDVDDVASVETATIPMSKGTLPSEGFFSHLAEPLILIGSIAVAVLLLFNVRS
jgi:hypothetical protein